VSTPAGIRDAVERLATQLVRCPEGVTFLSVLTALHTTPSRYHDVLAMRPNWPEALLGLASCYREMEQVAKAKAVVAAFPSTMVVRLQYMPRTMEALYAISNAGLPDDWGKPAAAAPRRVTQTTGIVGCNNAAPERDHA